MMNTSINWTESLTLRKIPMVKIRLIILFPFMIAVTMSYHITVVASKKAFFHPIFRVSIISGEARDRKILKKCTTFLVGHKQVKRQRLKFCIKSAVFRRFMSKSTIPRALVSKRQIRERI